MRSSQARSWRRDELSRRALSPRSTEAWSSPEDDFEAVALGVQAHGMETCRSFMVSESACGVCGGSSH